MVVISNKINSVSDVNHQYLGSAGLQSIGWYRGVSDALRSNRNAVKFAVPLKVFYRSLSIFFPSMSRYALSKSIVCQRQLLWQAVTACCGCRKIECPLFAQNTPKVEVAKVVVVTHSRCVR